jgi:hypothetical protein
MMDYIALNDHCAIKATYASHLRMAATGQRYSASNTKIYGTVIENSIVYSNSVIRNKNISNSMIGHFVSIENKSEDLNIGDYSASK